MIILSLFIAFLIIMLFEMLLMEITKIIMLPIINDNHNDGDNHCNKNESNDDPLYKTFYIMLMTYLT